MSKVLLTGIAGFAGSHLLEHILTHTDWSVVGVASWKHKGTPERIDEVLRGHPEWKDRVEIITHDLSSPIPERTKKRIGQCDYILNLAAESHVDRSIDDPVPFIQNNVNLVLTMLEFAREYKPQVFIQFSTDEVYGAAPEGVNHKEWSAILQSNPYSASKACQEAIAISYWRTYSVPVVITNTMNLFGETQDPEKYMAKTIRLIKRHEIVPVHGKDGEIGSRYYLHARNMADAILFLIEIPPAVYEYGKVMRPDRYNIVGDIELDNLQVATAISDVLNKPLLYELVDHHSTRPGHDRRYALNGAKLKKLGWEAPLEFLPSLKKYIEWTLEHDVWL
jgi:dTDP-glucose 4,6-dehydratase